MLGDDWGQPLHGRFLGLLLQRYEFEAHHFRDLITESYVTNYTHRTREPHQGGQGRAHQTRRRGTARQERLPTAGTGNQNGADGGVCAWEAATIKGMAWPASPVATGPGQPLLNRHQVGGVSRSPGGLFAQQEREPIRGRPTVRGKRTYGGRPRQRVEEQGTWAAQKYSEAGYGRPMDGPWTEVCGQQKQSNDPGNKQHILNTPIIGRR